MDYQARRPHRGCKVRGAVAFVDTIYPPARHTKREQARPDRYVVEAYTDTRGMNERDTVCISEMFHPALALRRTPGNRPSSD